MSPNRYRLRRLELRDFKSVAHAEVNLKPLTAIVGANSSGKSTFLQAVLALSQASRAEMNGAEFPLNGEFIRLGTFDETRNFLAESETGLIEFSFDVSSGPDRMWRVRDPEDDDWREWETVYSWHGYLSGRSDGDLGRNSGFAQLEQLQIELVELPLESDDEPRRVASCEISGFGRVGDDPEADRDRFGFQGRRGVDVPIDGRFSDWNSGESTGLTRAMFVAGIPTRLRRSTTALADAASRWWSLVGDVLADEIDECENAFDDGDPLEAPSDAALDTAAAVVEELTDPRLRRIGGGSLLPGVARRRAPAAPAVSRAPLSRGATRSTAPIRGLSSTERNEWAHDRRPGRAIAKSLMRLSRDERLEIAQSMVELGEARFVRDLRARLEGEPWIDEEVLVDVRSESAERMARAGLRAGEMFASGVRYLGPLREAPHVLYDPGPSKLDLGVRGEYSAAVLHAQAKRLVRVPMPQGRPRRMRLEEGLDYWLQWFGMAERARSRDRGRIGIGLNVTPPGLDREVDLTSVGVGVSQVLPVILLCLLADPGTLIVLEQPELHLHPKLQQDLADFLLACTKAGRQIILETHSEHLINRLRFRIAEDDTDETHNLVGLVFAENENGITRYREPEVNEFGGLGDDWPAGFLDLTARQSQDLVRASLAKRRRAEAALAAEEDSTES